MLAASVAFLAGCSISQSGSMEGDGGAGGTAGQGTPESSTDSTPAAEGGGGDGPTADGTGTVTVPGVACGGTMPMFPTFDKTCTSDSDCVVATHETSGCGDMKDIGINKGALAMFNAAEAECRGQYFSSTCFISNTTLEDGSSFRNSTSQTDPVTVACTSGACTTKNTGMTFACGDKSCAVSGNYCQAYTPSGAATQYKCVLPDATLSCGTLTIPTGCTCATASGNITVTCTSACTSC
jgi:hypothetical protein